MSSNDRDRGRGESDDGFIEKLVAVNRVSKSMLPLIKLLVTIDL